MVEVLNWDNPVDAGTSRILRSALRLDPTINPTPDERAAHLDDPGFGQALVASYMLNNTVATTLGDAYHYWSAGEQPEDFNPNFNPRAWIAQNVSKETQQELQEATDKGLFDYVAGPNGLQRHIAGALYEKNLIRNEAGSWVGATIGALGGALTDPLTYVPIGGEFWKTGSTAIRLGKSIMHAAGQMAPQEAALWSEQDFRTWQQSLMNVGVGSVLGGGIGFFGRTLRGDSELNPFRSPKDNPLAEENLGKQGAAAVVPGEGTDVVPHVSMGEPASVGAAAAPVEYPEKLGGNPVTNLLTGITPAGRSLQWTSGVARSLISKLIDNTAIFRKTERFGDIAGHSAEDIRDDYISRWSKETQVAAENLTNATRKDLGEIGARRLEPADLNAAAQKILTNTWTGDARDELVAKYGDRGAAAIESRATEYANNRQAVNASQEQAMRAAGVIRDDAKVETLSKQLEAVRKERNDTLVKHDEDTKKLRESLDTQIEAAVKAQKPTREVDAIRRDRRDQLVARDANRRETSSPYEYQINGIQSELNHQRGLAPALGPEYGHAQLWERGQVARTQERFKNFLFGVVKSTPDEAYLRDNFGMTLGDFEKLRTENPAQYYDMVREWSGEAHDQKVRQLQNALEDSRQREKLAKLDFNDTLRSLGVLKAGEKQIELSEYGRYRDALNARVAAEREVRTNLLAEERAIVEAATAARQRTLDRLKELTAAGETASPELTTALARQEERANQVAKQLRDSEARLNDLTDKQLRAERAYSDARDTRAVRKSNRQALQEATKDVLAQRELASKNVGQVKGAIRAANKEAPAWQVVEDIAKNLMTHGQLPASALESTVSESGRFKARRLVLTPEQKIEAAREGWLRTDLPNILRTQDLQIAGHLGLREALDIGRGRTFEGWDDVTGAMRSDYERHMQANPTRRPALENEQTKALKDLNGMKARLLMQVDPGGDRDGWLMWLSKQMRQYNFIRYAPGMFPSALPDIANFVLQHRVVPMLAEHGSEAFRGLTTFEPKMQTEFRRMLSASELAIHEAMASQRVSEGEVFRSGGIGAPGSLTNRITSRVDHVGEGLANFGATISGLNTWDRFWKTLSGLQMAHDLKEQVGRYGGLSDLERTNLASLGIGEREASRLQQFIERHGETDASTGLWDPHLENWHETTEGQKAARDFRIAVQRDMNRSRFMPGLGDRPLINDKWYGKLFNQFQGFGFAFVNRYMTPMLQRAVHYHDLRAAGSFAALMAAGSIAMVLKDLSRGITPDQRFNLSSDPTAPYKFAHELINRSQLLGYLSPYVDAMVTLTGADGATRHERESTVERLLGVNSSLVGDVGRFATTLSGAAQGQEKSSKVIDKLTAIAPYAALLRTGAHTYDIVGNGTPVRNPYKK